jgi:hypothetical protein
MTEPNIYNLQDAAQGIHIIYSPGTGGAIGGMQYVDPTQTRFFKSTDLRTVDSEVGTLVTATLRTTVDGGSTTFTLVVPQVALSGPAQHASINTFGITTLHLFSPMPALNVGQREIDSTVVLNGTAEFIPF